MLDMSDIDREIAEIEKAEREMEEAKIHKEYAEMSGLWGMIEKLKAEKKLLEEG